MQQTSPNASLAMSDACVSQHIFCTFHVILALSSLAAYLHTNIKKAQLQVHVRVISDLKLLNRGHSNVFLHFSYPVSIETVLRSPQNYNPSISFSFSLYEIVSHTVARKNKLFEKPQRLMDTGLIKLRDCFATSRISRCFTA